MSRNVLNILLSVVAVILIFFIIKSVKDPIDRQNKIEKTEKAVIAKLEEIKKAQMVYKDINDTFANNFEDLIKTIKDGKVAVLKKLGGKAADTLSVIEVDTTFESALTQTFEVGYPIEDLGKVPPLNKENFEIRSKILDKGAFTVPVFEVIDPSPINPKRTLKIGSLDDAIYTGNWK